MPKQTIHTISAHLEILDYPVKIAKLVLELRMGKKSWRSSRTGREYRISLLYTCESTHLVYLVRCDLCNMDYVGQTTNTMRRRHLGHRSEIRSGADGVGRHFLENHGQGLNLREENTFEEMVMKHFKLTIIGSVQPNMP